MVIGIDASRANVAQRTGTERYAWEVIRRLPERFLDHRIRLYVREPLRPDWGQLGEKVEVRILDWAPGLLWSHLRLSWEMLWHRPDLLFVPADTVPLVHPRRTVTTIHDVAFERFPELYRTASVQRRLSWLRPIVHLLVRLVTLGRYSASERDYHRWSVRQAIRACRRIMTVSEFSKQEIVATLGVEPDRVVVTPIGVLQAAHFTSITAEQRRATLTRLGCLRPFSLFLGRLEQKKNIRLIVEAYLEMQRRWDDCPDLVLAGNPGYGWEPVEPLLSTARYPDRIHVLGWLSDADADVLKCSASVMVFLSDYEGFGIPALESLSAGVPVLASRAGALPEILGPAGHYVDTTSFDAVVEEWHRLVVDPELRRRLLVSGRDRVTGYTWDRTADLTSTVLQGVLANEP